MSVSCSPIILLSWNDHTLLEARVEVSPMRKIKEKIKKKMNKDGLYQHHCSLELRFREWRKREERDQIRLPVCSESCLSKIPCVF